MVVRLLIVLTLLAYGYSVHAQGDSSWSREPLPAKKSDTSHPILLLPDLLIPTPSKLLKSEGARLKEMGKGLKPANPLNHLKADTALLKSTFPGFPRERLLDKPWVSLKGGYVNYNFMYRSSIDTPFTEKDITQHVITGGLDLVAAKCLPLKVNYWIRRSNSSLFRNIADIQVMFDPAGFRNSMLSNARQKWLSALPSLNDSLLEKLYNVKLGELKSAQSWLLSRANAQKLREYREIIAIPSLTYDTKLPDSTNQRRADSMQRQAKLFIDTYSQARGRYNKLQAETDSLQQSVKEMRNRMQQYRQLTKAQPGDWASYEKWKSALAKYQPPRAVVPDKYNWLMGIRSFSVGKTPVNYSELTAKNINITGVNFEYNSWYYVAVTAGVVDYRFRDFVVSRLSSAPQYLYMLRLGIGRLEKNYFILSALRGRKQLYTLTNNSGPTSVTITGLSVEGKWQLHRTTYLIAEAGQSLSPDYRSTPPATNGKFSLTDNINKALSVQFRTSLPKTHSIVEGMYKYTGANYQSFSSYQTNAAAKSWYLKWEQSFFNRQFRLTGALRSNEFTNPYILQDYKSNTVFKSISAVFHRKKWPVISLGYMPMSQFTVIDQQVVESRFQTLTASINHFYRLGTRQASSTLVYNRFYNNSRDTGFIYFNSVNLFYAQNFLFKRFSAGIAASHSNSRQYELNVMEGNVQFSLQRFSVGGGVKINSLNRLDSRAGGYVNGNVRISRKDMIYVSCEHGYLPGTGRQLVRNDMGNIQYNRVF